MKLNSLRAKLIGLVGTTTLAFVVLIGTGAITTAAVQKRLTAIADRHVPRLELRPRMEADFENMARRFQDAVAAQDPDLLSEAASFKDQLLRRLVRAGAAVEPRDAAALRTAIDDYFAAANDVSRRLIAGEVGESLVESMAEMQTKRALALRRIVQATAYREHDLANAFATVTRAQTDAARLHLLTSIGCLVLVVLLSLWIGRGVLRSVGLLTDGLARFGTGDFVHPIAVLTRDELGEVAIRANEMAQNLDRLGKERDRIAWITNGHAGLAKELRGEMAPEEVASRAARFLARYLDAPVAAFYSVEADGALQLRAHCGRSLDEDAGEGSPPTGRFRAGEGLVGQAALQEDVVVISDAPAGYLRVRSGLGEAAPRALVLVPMLHLGKVSGVLELALFKPWSAAGSELLLSTRETLSIALEVARAREATQALLSETQSQARRLIAQEDELRSTNDELQAQQEELRQTNEELTSQTEELRAQRRTLEQRNAELDGARRRLEQQTHELTVVSNYKSQFLANMSHELRTPLNSMLLLSNLLAENESQNLTNKQVEFSKTIHAAGQDLLGLINQVLDLAKIEAGKQEIVVAAMPLRQLVEHAEQVFGPLARDKGLRFVVELAPDLRETISSDRQRVVQILNNLLGNAVKFTQEGEVALRITRCEADASFRRADLRADRVVAITVSDTGVGIPREAQERIFAPFEQMDAAMDRRYGGTGLGLTIARELATLLGGELQVESTPGRGSAFVCFLPYEAPERAVEGAATGLSRAPVGSAPRRTPSTRAAADDRESVRPGDAWLLIIEDDRSFAEAFGDLIRAHGLKYMVAVDGETGLRLARERAPSGIILDVILPGMDGWAVMEHLRADPITRDIPVHFVSALEGSERGLTMGAVGYVTKPAAPRDLVRVVEALAPKRPERSTAILVVEPDVAAGDSLVRCLEGESLEVRRVTSAGEALTAVGQKRFGCVILDLALPDMDGLELLEALRAQCGADRPAAIVYTGRALRKAEVQRLEAYAEAVVLKEGSSGDRLLDEVRLFVRRVRDGLDPRHPAPRHAASSAALRGRKVLVVDDDMRTVYALSAMLRAKGVDVLVADSGRVAIEMLAEHPDIEAVLMDIMMPEMDGYAAMREIRRVPRLATLPIIALTAKAMKGDEEKCLEAGASAYLTKPIDPERLIDMLQAGLSSATTDATG